jgi:hypothetical protein
LYPIATVGTCKLIDLNSVSKMEDEALIRLAVSSPISPRSMQFKPVLNPYRVEDEALDGIKIKISFNSIGRGLIGEDGVDP